MRSRQVLCLCLLTTAASAYSPAVTTASGLRLEIPSQDPWTAVETARPVPVKLHNLTDQPTRGVVRIGLTDDWRVDGPAEQSYQLAPQTAAELTFPIVAGRGTYSVFYPIHATATVVRGGQTAQVHTVLVVAADLETPAAGRKPGRTVPALRASGALQLDGQLTEWDNAVPVHLGADEATIGKPEPADYGLDLRALWDPTALYLSVQATDDQLSGQDLTSRDFVDSDYLRFVISKQPAAGRAETRLTSDDLVLSLAPGGSDGKPHLKLVQYDGSGRGEFDLKSVRIGVNSSGTGWTAELALPWQALGIQASAGEQLGINLFGGDSDAGGREAELSLGGTLGEYWTNPQMFVPLVLSAQTQDTSGAALPLLTLTGRGVVPLARLRPGRVVINPFGGQSYAIPATRSTDELSRATFQAGTSVTRSESRVAITLHPPWKGPLGEVAGDYRLALPDRTPITFSSGLAIRDSAPTEPASDGVLFKVEVAPEGGQFKTLFERFTAAKQWDDISVDLSAYAGQTITLRLVGDPGPKKNTVCDSGYWGNPLLRVGAAPATESPEAKQARAQQALALAQQERAGQDTPHGWRLESEAGLTGVGVVPGPAGLVDAQIAYSSQAGEVVFDGFEIEVGSTPLADILEPGVKATTQRGGLGLSHRAALDGQELNVTATIGAKGGGLTIAFAMPGLQRDERGEPRFTRLALGPASVATKRAYFGHGHVLVGCPRFTLGYGGFSVSTRFVGVDYESGLSLVTGTDPVPDRFEHDQERHVTSLVAHHDATFTFVPSEHGAFAGARVWRKLAGLRPAGGVKQIQGKMCIDQWGGDYGEAAKGLRLATKYGVDEAVFVKHVWQRWGYDYRLPDIYPPAGNQDDFMAMANAARANGRLFALHDNYIDFYPDATGFTYDETMFRADGTPWLAWWNEGRQARSYKWLPQAIMPYLERNLKLIAPDLQPNSYFIDVFSAMAPVDYYDRAGRFYPKLTCQRYWGEAFDKVREALHGPTISEAGHDALIGHLDAAQADHLTITKEGGKHLLKLDFEQWDRVPWYDMGHHGNFVLFAGGLGGRYQGDRPTSLHGYGSDDYLTDTILGGRTPMVDGPFSRRTVMTYYLLQPICNELEQQEMLAHRFAGDNVRRQQIDWSDGAVVVNRGETDWTVNGAVLPEYGFLAKAGKFKADITRRDDQITAMSSAPGLLFVDARPPDLFVPSLRDITADVSDFKDLGARRLQFKLTLHVREPAPEGNRLFVHFAGPAKLLPGWVENSDILFQAGGSNYRGQMLAQPGDHVITVEGSLPEKLLPGEVKIKYGFYDPEHGGGRMALRQAGWGDGRYDAGAMEITGAGAATKLAWQPVGLVQESDRDNLKRKVIDFGPVKTNTALRLAYTGNTWTITPLPGSLGATITLDLSQLGAAGKQVASIEELDLDGKVVTTTKPTVQGNLVTFKSADLAFQYRVRVK